MVAMDGPRLALRCDSDGGWAPTGPAIAPGTQDWQKIELGFVAPQGPGMTPSGRLDAPRKGSTAVEAASRDTALPSQQFHRDVVAVTVRLIRIPRFSYEEPMGGTIWLDDFRITRIG